MSGQQSQKRGKQSTAQKRDSSRHDFEPIPATSKVAGASGGNQPVGRTAAEVNEHYTGERMRERAEELRDGDDAAAAGESVNTGIESTPKTEE